MNSESTGNNKINTDKEFNEWADRLEKMDDLSISREVFNRVMAHSDIDDESKNILDLSYNYCFKLIQQGKPLDINLLKIYLEEIKGIEVSRLNMVNIILLLGLCGINFSKK